MLIDSAFTLPYVSCQLELITNDRTFLALGQFTKTFDISSLFGSAVIFLSASFDQKFVNVITAV
jgi:hypothetical protein